MPLAIDNAIEAGELGPPDLLLPGARIGRYTVVRLLGRGGMGDVYEAAHAELGERAALKLLRPEHARDRDRRVRFLHEARTAASVRHPHVVQVIDMGIEEGLPFLVMEYLEGEDLSSLLGRDGRLRAERALDIALPIANALSALHEQGILHRDVKTSNVFLERTPGGGDRPKLCDFGLSKVIADDGRTPLTATACLLGTPHVMAPEQVQGAREATALSDQYSLAVMIYECLTGRRPFVGESLYELLNAIVVGEPEPPGHSWIDGSPELEAVVLRAMSRDPGRRFGSVRELARALLPFASPPLRSAYEPVPARWIGPERDGRRADQSPAGGARPPPLRGRWSFVGANPKDATGRWGPLELMGAELAQGGLVLKRGGWARVRGYRGPAVSEKTLIVWLRLNGLEDRRPGGAAMSLSAQRWDQFDAIVFAEREDLKWMAGSTGFARTIDVASPAAVEHRAGAVVQMAVTYEDAARLARVTLYRNGEQLARYEKGPLVAWHAEDVEALFGCRHTLGDEVRGHLNATIWSAELHGRALSPDEIRAAFARGPDA